MRARELTKNLIRKEMSNTHQYVIGDVHQKLCLLEVLNPKAITHFLNGLLRKWRDIPPQDQYCVGDTFILHAIC